MDNRIIAHIDKTVVSIGGIEVKGLRPIDLERKLEETIERKVRIIGVAGDSIQMDIYGMEPEAIFKSEEGIVKAVSLVEGILASEVIKISSAEKIVQVDIDDIPKGYSSGCQKERWINIV